MSTSLLHEPFDDLQHQSKSVELGMWIFLLTEIILFGSLILGYAALRVLHADAFASASHLLNWKAGALNTSVLLTSSLTMALAVQASEMNKRRTLTALLFLTALFGLIFLVIKGYEYHSEWVEHLVPTANFKVEGSEPHHMRLFFIAYFVLTGLHALHLCIGIVWLSVLGTINASSTRYLGYKSITIHTAGLYWHLVDCVWVFLFPLLYLVGEIR